MCVCNNARLNITIFEIHISSECFIHRIAHCAKNKILDDRFTDILQAIFSASIIFLLFATISTIKPILKNCVKTRYTTNGV